MGYYTKYNQNDCFCIAKTNDDILTKATQWQQKIGRPNLQ